MDGETVEVSEERVRKAVRELKNGIKMLTWVINRCLNGEETLQQWKVAYISSIHKKGSKKDCYNYRGISVMSVMSRLYGKY